MTPSYDPLNWYWIIGGKDIYSSKSASIIGAEDKNYQDWLKRGNVSTAIESMGTLISVLRAANVPPYHLVPSRLIVDRLQAAGKLEAANAALESADLYTRQRWNTRAEIYADDPTAIVLLKAIGVSPEDILSPEA